MHIYYNCCLSITSALQPVFGCFILQSIHSIVDRAFIAFSSDHSGGEHVSLLGNSRVDDRTGSDFC